MPDIMKAMPTIYFVGDSKIIGVIVRNTATAKVTTGIIMGTLYGRGRSGCVLRNTSKHTTAAP